MRIPILEKLMEGPAKRAGERAARLLEQGKVDDAVEALRSGLGKAPRDPDLLLELARVLSVANRCEEAASHLRTLLRAVPEGADRVRELAEMAKLRGLEAGHMHDVLAEHALRGGQVAAGLEHLERIERAELARYAEAHRKRFEAGLRPGDKPARASLLSGIYVALAHEAAGNDLAALQMYGRLREADPDIYAKLRDRLAALATRNYRNPSLRRQVLDQYLAAGDGERAAQEASLQLDASPEAAPAVAQKLDAWLQRHPDDAGVRLSLARARWAEGRADEAADLLDPLVSAGDRDAELGDLLARWRLDRPDAGRIALLQAEILGRGGRAAQAVQAISDAGDRLSAGETEPALERILEASPGEARAWRLLAELRQSRGDRDGAVEAVAGLRREAPGRAEEGAGVLRAVLAADPEHRRAHRLLAEILLDRGEAAAAVTLLRHLIGLAPEVAAELTGAFESLASANPSAMSIRLGAADAWMAAGEPARALPHLEAVAGAGAEFAAQCAHRLSLVIHRSPRHAGEVAPLAESLVGKLADPAAVPFLRAEAAAAAGDPERAAALLGECYGLAAERAGDAVASCLERLVERHPDRSSPRILLANLLLDRGQALRAVSVVADASDPDPGAVSLLLERLEAAVGGRRDPEVRAGLARLLLLAGRADEALAAADQALREGGAKAPSLLHLIRGEAHRALGAREAAVAALAEAARDAALLPRAVAVLEEIAEAAPGDAGARLALGRLRVDAGRIGEGLVLLVEVAAGDAARAGDALRGIDAAAAAHPGDPRPHLAAARLLVAAGDPTAAAARLGAARSAGATASQVEALVGELRRGAPDDPGVLLLAGRARAAADPEEACALLERSAALDPAHGDAALAALAEMMRAKPDRPEPRLSAARLLHARGDEARAFETLSPVLHRDPGAPAAGELLRDLRRALPGEPEPSLALARWHLANDRPEEALAEVRAARDAGAPAAAIEAPLDRIIDRLGEPGAILLRAAARADLGRLDDALSDLDRAARNGRPAEAAAAALAILAGRPGHAGARRLHVRLLRDAGDEAAALRSLDAGLQAGGDADLRCDLLVERADLRRARGDAGGAADDLRRAEEAAEDRDEFLGRLHAQRQRRVQGRIGSAPPAERVRLLLELGRLDEAERLAASADLAADQARGLRAALRIARGDPAAGLRLLRASPPAALLVDAAQRCDRPWLALAAVDRLLEAREDGPLRRARPRLVREVWRHDLDEARRALVARTSFAPRAEAD
jgi:predicted Zn-dependent protease